MGDTWHEIVLGQGISERVKVQLNLEAPRQSHYISLSFGPDLQYKPSNMHRLLSHSH